MPIHRSICASTAFISIYPSAHPSIRLSVCPPVRPSVHPAVRPFIRLFSQPNKLQTIHLSINPSTYLHAEMTGPCALDMIVSGNQLSPGARVLFLPWSLKHWGIPIAVPHLSDIQNIFSIKEPYFRHVSNVQNPSFILLYCLVHGDPFIGLS